MIVQAVNHLRWRALAARLADQGADVAPPTGPAPGRLGHQVPWRHRSPGACSLCDCGLARSACTCCTTPGAWCSPPAAVDPYRLRRPDSAGVRGGVRREYRPQRAGRPGHPAV